MTSPKKPGGTGFSHRFFQTLSIISLLVNDANTYPRLIRIFHGFDTTMFTVKEVIENLVDGNSDYYSHSNNILKSSSLRKEIIRKQLDMSEFRKKKTWNWDLWWTNVDRDEKVLRGHFNPYYLSSTPEAGGMGKEIKFGLDEGLLVPKELKMFEFDNNRRFGAVIYLGHMWTQYRYTIDVTLAFCAHKDEWDTFCKNIL